VGPLRPLVAALVLGCGAGTNTVTCRDLDTGYAASYRGPAALAECLADPRMQSEGHRREAVASPGRYDFGGAGRFELTGGMALRGAGSDRTTLYASRPTRSVFGDDIRSALWVRGAGVELGGFTFDGSCRDGPSPGPECARDDDQTLLAIVVACGYGFERGPDCDVDGLRIDDVRVLNVKTPFVATGSDPNPAAGQKALFANFRDFHWTIRRFSVSGRDDPFRYARIFELGNASTADISQGPGAGVAEPRHYVVDIEDTSIDTHVGKAGGQLAGVLTMAVNAPVSLAVNLRRSSLRGTERVVGIATHALEGPGRDAGSALFRCEDSELVADQRDWAGKLKEDPKGSICPPFDAAVYVGEFSLPGGSHRSRAELVRCNVSVEGWLALCPAPASIDTGGERLAAHASVCLRESRVEPAVRGPIEACQSGAGGGDAGAADAGASPRRAQVSK